MSKLKKLMLMLILSIAIFSGVAFNVKAVDFIPIVKYNNTTQTIKYRGTNVDVMMPREYIAKESGFRAAWVTPVTGDYNAYFANEQQYKAEMIRILNTLEYYHMNAVVFHIRTHHDAMYRSSLNKISKYYAAVDFDEFDPLSWFIEECHKRGIEFHAWLNPYRIGGGGTLEQVAATYPPHNPASDVNNLLRGNQNIILDPGRPAVRSFLIDTVKEIIENYDVDAIHFDDYFYEAEIDDYKTRELYNVEGLSIGDFRRKQVDLLIEGIHKLLKEHNEKNGKYVQLGISPTGIYRNGSYVARENYQYDGFGRLIYPLGANTSGYTHYDSPLYADTLKWCNEQWIDYIVPQTYYALDYPGVQFADAVEWWAGALKYSKVNLYLGIALYKIGSSNEYGWSNNLREFATQVQYTSGLNEVRGHVIFSFSQVSESLRPGSTKAYHNMHNVKNEMWTKDALLPEIRTMFPEVLNAVTNLQVYKTEKGYRLEFNAIEEAKTYAIYRSKNPLKFDESELIRVIGKIEKNGKVNYLDEIATSDNYYYGVIAISKTNSKGNPASVSTTNAKNGSLLPVSNIPTIYQGAATVVNKYVTITWEKVYPYFGSEYEYEVYISNDGVNFRKNETTIKLTNNYYSTSFLANALGNMYYYVVVKNDISYDRTSTYTINVKQDLGKVNGFGIKGDFFAGEFVEFTWHALDDINTSYKVQTSPNGVIWKNLSGDLTIKGANALFKTKLKDEFTQNYYRVIAENASGMAVSNELKLNAYLRLPDIVVKYQGQIVTGPIYVNQSEKITLEWDKLVVDGVNISYYIEASPDLKNYQIGTYFDGRNRFVSGENTTGYEFYGPYGYHALFVKITAMANDYRSREIIIEIRITPNNPSVKEIFDNYYKYQEAYLRKTSIFK